MNLIKYKHDIFAYENFLSAEKCAEIIDTYEPIDDAWINPDGKTSIIGFFSVLDDNNESKRLEGIDVNWKEMNEILDQIQDAVELSFGKELSPSSLHLGRWTKGSKMDYHADDVTLDGNPTAFFFYKYASLIYLNDDYDGGFLEFRDHNIKLKPKPGTLVIFPGGIENVHRVTEVTKGKRYTLSSWWIDYQD